MPSQLGASLPTTAAGALWAIAIMLVALRVATLLQMAPSLSSGVRLSPSPGLYLASWILAVLASVTVVVGLLRRGRPLGQLATGIDLLVAIVLFFLGLAAVAPELRQGNWISFYQGYALNVLITACAVRGALFWCSSVAAVLGASIVYLSASLDSTQLSTTLGNLLTLIVLPVIARAGALYILRIARDADKARTAVADLAQREETRRAQLAFHNGAALMRLLADPSIDPAVRASLQPHAEAEAQRMRSYLRGEIAPASGDAAGFVSLASTVAGAAGQFSDLPVTLALELGREVRVRPALARAVERAVTSLLLNVRTHAEASEVVVHLDGDDTDHWELSVHDDGKGFDAEAATLGVGLTEVVHGELARHEVRTELSSTPGTGTMVSLRGRREDQAARR